MPVSHEIRRAGRPFRRHFILHSPLPEDPWLWTMNDVVAAFCYEPLAIAVHPSIGGRHWVWKETVEKVIRRNLIDSYTLLNFLDCSTVGVNSDTVDPYRKELGMEVIIGLRSASPT